MFGDPVAIARAATSMRRSPSWNHTIHNGRSVGITFLWNDALHNGRRSGTTRLWCNLTHNEPSAQRAYVPHLHNGQSAQRAFVPRLHNGASAQRALVPHPPQRTPARRSRHDGRSRSAICFITSKKGLLVTLPGRRTVCPSVAPPPRDRDHVRADCDLQKSDDLADAQRRQLHGRVGPQARIAVGYFGGSSCYPIWTPPCAVGRSRAI